MKAVLLLLALVALVWADPLLDRTCGENGYADMRTNAINIQACKKCRGSAGLLVYDKYKHHTLCITDHSDHKPGPGGWKHSGEGQHYHPEHGHRTIRIKGDMVHYDPEHKHEL
eukprot:Hpha_TRINITY_DN3038_c0_g1::TRINITY_DN3038_c0_g1_i1::g.138719::m.138719